MKTALIASLFLFIISPLYAQYSISGYVIDFGEAEPIEGALVFVHNEYNISFDPPINTTTDKSGYYEFDLPEGRYSVNVSVFYEVDADSFAFVYQPGVATLEGEYFMKQGYDLNFGFSMKYILSNHQLKNQTQGAMSVGMHTREFFVLPLGVYNFVRPKVHAPGFAFKRSETSFIQEKTW
ncbi:MAG: carboxypeptidase regulatory-like domain-containing protein [Balneola sp.]|nr:MAG: carboxypeptidase regulatory-like domain-containing protein [Balneola sp.]